MQRLAWLLLLPILTAGSALSCSVEGCPGGGARQIRITTWPVSVPLWTDPVADGGGGWIVAEFPDGAGVGTGVIEFYQHDVRVQVPVQLYEHATDRSYGCGPGGVGSCPYSAIVYNLCGLPDGDYVVVHRRSASAGLAEYQTHPWAMFDGEAAWVGTIRLADEAARANGCTCLRVTQQH